MSSLSSDPSGVTMWRWAKVINKLDTAKEEPNIDRNSSLPVAHQGWGRQFPRHFARCVLLQQS
eukprot:2707057-Amphidinium_carterae.1